MNTSEQTGGNGSTFRFDRGDDWVHFSADMGRLCADIGDQVRRAVAQVDIDAIIDDVQRAVDGIAAEAREAAANRRRSQGWQGPTRVRVDIHADQAARPTSRPERTGPIAEHKAVLDLLVQGKISAEEAARLLDALGG